MMARERLKQTVGARTTGPHRGARIMDKNEILAWLKGRGSSRNIQGMARYGIRSAHAFGVSMGTMAPLVKQLGRDHALAQVLWESGWHEARVVAALVDEPRCVTRAQMNRWAGDFLPSFRVSECARAFCFEPRGPIGSPPSS